MCALLLRNIRLSDCDRALDSQVLIEDGLITRVDERIDPPGGCEIIDGGGHTLLPAFVDLHAHFRDPGLTHKEDVRTGCLAAVHGGYTTVNLMPNTKPVCSDMDTVRYVRQKAAELGLCDVLQTVSITRGFDGVTVDHLDSLEGVDWLTDDGFGVDSTATMLRAMEIARGRGMGLMLHEEDSSLSKLNMYLAEEIPTYRDVALAGLTGCRTHFCHVSTIKAMDAIIAGKQEGIPVTCEVTPHHLALTDAHGGKVNPPLRGEEHRRYLIECIKRGHVDAIATDHAPHAAEEKAAGANGFTGLDLSFATCYTTLVRGGHIPLERLSALMSEGPARLLGVNKGRIAPGFEADLALADLDTPFVAEERHLHSKSKNSPMLGATLYGQILWTMKKGRLVYEKAD